MAGKGTGRKRQSLDKPACKYGASCYQKNPEHHRKYSHPLPSSSRNNLNVEDVDNKISPKKQISEDCKGNPASLDVPLVATSKQSPRKRKNSKRASSPENVAENIKGKFLVEMPQDFYDFWDFCNTIDGNNPSEAFAELGLHLVGPYDVLSKSLRSKDYEGDVLCHWRYYYDPPEYLTVVKRDGKDWYHLGYFRDDPSEMPFAVASNSAAVGPKFKLMGDNLFSAMNCEITASIKNASKKVIKEKFSKIQEELQKVAKSKKYALGMVTQKTKAREEKVVAKTFHGFGMSVPYDQKRQVGYRSLPESDAAIKQLLTRISECSTDELKLQQRVKLDDIFTCVQFANDECDYGMGLELGIDIFCFGDPYFHTDIECSLPVSYELLNRPQYGQIMKAHLKNRRKGDNLSIVNVTKDNS